MSLIDPCKSDVNPIITDHINSGENIVTHYSEVLKNKPKMERQHTNMTHLFLREVNPFKGVTTLGTLDTSNFTTTTKSLKHVLKVLQLNVYFHTI